MEAFKDCKVSKNELLGSLKAHQSVGNTDADRFKRDKSWKFHDFAPGKEDNHSLYPELFGLPESFAYLQDGIFEGLPLEDSKKWSVKVISAIPIGCDVGRKIDEFLYWILSGGDSPISEYRDKKEIKAVAELYRRKLDGESVKQEEWVEAANAAYDDDVYDDDDAVAYATVAYIVYYGAAYVADDAVAAVAIDNVVYAAADVATAAADVATKKMADKLINILKGN